jgi:hypothetical protein
MITFVKLEMLKGSKETNASLVFKVVEHSLSSPFAKPIDKMASIMNKFFIVGL